MRVQRKMEEYKMMHTKIWRTYTNLCGKALFENHVYGSNYALFENHVYGSNDVYIYIHIYIYVCVCLRICISGPTRMQQATVNRDMWACWSIYVYVYAHFTNGQPANTDKIEQNRNRSDNSCERYIMYENLRYVGIRVWKVYECIRKHSIAYYLKVRSVVQTDLRSMLGIRWCDFITWHHEELQRWQKWTGSKVISRTYEHIGCLNVCFIISRRHVVRFQCFPYRPPGPL